VVLLLPCCWLGSLSLQDFLSRRKEKKKKFSLAFLPSPLPLLLFPSLFQTLIMMVVVMAAVQRKGLSC